MNVCVITEDRMIEVEGEALNFDFTIDANIHAIQWNGTTGHVEFKDNTPNEDITDFSAYQYLVDAYNTEKQRVADAEAQAILDAEAALTVDVVVAVCCNTQWSLWLQRLLHHSVESIPDTFGFSIKVYSFHE